MSPREKRGAIVNEQTLKRGLMRELHTALPEAVAIRHEDRYTHGIPDLSVSLGQKTSWWEIKLAAPDCESRGVQRYLCTRLNQTSHCRYVIYVRGIPKGSRQRPRQIRIVKPEDIDIWSHAGLVISEDEFDQAALVRHIAKVHGVTL